MSFFKSWRQFLNENVDPFATTKVQKPGVTQPDEYSAPYEYDDTPEKSRETYFGKNPDSIQCIKDLRNESIDVFPPDFYDCMEKEGYTKLGAGSFRATFNVPENPELVLKVVGPAVNQGRESRRSMEMNRDEAQAFYQTSSDLVPKVYDSAKDYFWIVSEKVKDITSWEEMQEFFPVWKDEPTEDFQYWFQKLVNTKTIPEVAAKQIDKRAEHTITYGDGEELVNDPLILNIRDLLAQFDLPSWDIRPYNVGYAMRNGKKQFVILDPGFGLGTDAGTVAGENPRDAGRGISAIFDDDIAKTWHPAPEDTETPIMKENITKNWRLFLENAEIKGPNDFLYDIATSPSEITINLLDPVTKEPVESKKEGTNAYISLEKRTNVPHWEVAWSSSPLNSEKVGTIMYLMALELAEEGLAPDSYETSPDAERVWAKFMQNNEYGVEKEKKVGAEHENDENPFFFVFSKSKKNILDQFSDKITQKQGKSEEKDEFDPEKEEKFEYFDPDAFDWEDLDELDEEKDPTMSNEPSVAHARGTYSSFINKLRSQGPNKTDTGMDLVAKSSSKDIKSAPPGAAEE